MRKSWRDEEEKLEAKFGCLGVIILILIAAAIWFIQPLIIVKAWTMFAVGMFGLPMLDYWTAFWVNWAVGCLFGPKITKIGNKE